MHSNKYQKYNNNYTIFFFYCFSFAFTIILSVNEILVNEI